VLTATHVISTLSSKKLNAVLAASKTESNTAVTAVLSSRNPSSSSVYVTNFIFPVAEKNVIHPPGFGYLIPRPPEGYIPTAENRQGMLGVIFDSESLSEQDSVKSHTKMTIISGGPYFSLLPSTPDVEAMLNDVRSHLGADYEIPDPVFTKVTECRECIPLYEVGHVEWVEELESALQAYGRRLHVIGSSIGGVAVPDCVEQGRRAGRNVVASCQSVITA
jgi:protoporphyrinogen/coproporphyrinogen III oxidase